VHCVVSSGGRDRPSLSDLIHGSLGLKPGGVCHDNDSESVPYLGGTCFSTNQIDYMSYSMGRAS
jgi:hypothetical protein